MRSEKENIACIGAGYWGINLVRNFYELGVLRCVCDLDPQRRADVGAAFPTLKLVASIDEVFADQQIRGVAIASPAETHGKLVRRALLADKDVFVEKPLCLSVEEGKELVSLASERHRVLMVGHLLWYHPAVLKLKELVEEGALGRIQYIYSNRLNLGKIRREENILWSFAPHDVSVILGLVGEMPESVEAHGGNYLHNRIADVTVSLLSFPSGVKAHVFVSWLHPFKEQKLIVVGDRGMAVFDDVAPQDKLRIYPHSIEWKNQIPVASKAESQPVAFDSKEPLRAECAHFLECIQNRTSPRTDGREGLRVLKVLDQCQKALERESAPQPVNGSTRPNTSFFVHESSFVDEDVHIGDGTTIWHFSHILKKSRIGKNCRIGQNVMIGPNAEIGDGVKIQNNVSVYEGVTLEDHVFCGPSMVFTNVYNPRSDIPRMDELRRTIVRRGATLGANCTVVCGVTIGQYAFVGAGAVVVRDVPDFALLVGNPARIIGWMCACGNRILFNGADGSGACRSCQRQYIKTESEVRAAL
ncbi:MAG: Gfo/Idh/MocA family oxidoreductase [Candidatus Omnitrophota bacterium]|nr:Gfo/Idh/MocA family oxidoreductase [Candidatus Omnitrophota bacterium]